VVPEVTLAPHSRNSEVRATPHPNRTRPSSARGLEERERARTDEIDSDQDGEGDNMLVTPVQPPRRELVSYQFIFKLYSFFFFFSCLFACDSY
jgi:hypothetical protein